MGELHVMFHWHVMFHAGSNPHLVATELVVKPLATQCNAFSAIKRPTKRLTHLTITPKTPPDIDETMVTSAARDASTQRPSLSCTVLALLKANQPNLQAPMTSVSRRRVRTRARRDHRVLIKY